MVKKMSKVRARDSSFQKQGCEGGRGMRCHWKGSWRMGHCVSTSFCFVFFFFFSLFFYGHASLLSSRNDKNVLNGPLNEIWAFKKW